MEVEVVQSRCSEGVVVLQNRYSRCRGAEMDILCAVVVKRWCRDGV